MINLSSNAAIESAVFLKWDIPNYQIEYISDYHTAVTIGGQSYANAGKLLSISSINDELKASPSELSIALSGIPTGSVSDVLSKEIKGSNIEIYRGFFNPTTHGLLDLSPDTNPLLKFKGIVTNYGVGDDIDVISGIATTSIVLTCNSIVEILGKKVNGRRTNPRDFPTESSMNRVLALSNSNFQFGAPR
tara:strand:- start:1439 stop:2008 length:570 start_codon:yes stop_codon:yes gene_type:complete